MRLILTRKSKAEHNPLQAATAAENVHSGKSSRAVGSKRPTPCLSLPETQDGPQRACNHGWQGMPAALALHSASVSLPPGFPSSGAVVQAVSMGTSTFPCQGREPGSLVLLLCRDHCKGQEQERFLSNTHWGFFQPNLGKPSSSNRNTKNTGSC